MVHRGQTIITEGVLNSNFYVVKDGTVRLQKMSPEGISKDANTEFFELNDVHKSFFNSRILQKKSLSLKLLGPGSILNFENSILKKVSDLTVVVESSDALLIKLSGESMKVILESNVKNYQTFIEDKFEQNKQEIQAILERNKNLVYQKEVSNTTERKNLIALKSIKKRKERIFRDEEELEYGPKNHFCSAWDKFICQGFVSTTSKLDIAKNSPEKGLNKSNEITVLGLNSVENSPK